MVSPRSTANGTDIWSDWLARTRHGEDRAERKRILRHLEPFRRQILSRACIRQGDIVVDIGCGDGFLAFAALRRVGVAGKIVFVDISPSMLDICRNKAARLGAYERCHFVCSPASDLSQIGTASVDVILLRSVLIYEVHKEAAFREMYRVLRDNGRLSLFEPICRYSRRSTFVGPWDLSEEPEIANKLDAAIERLQPANTDPMYDFDERDLLRMAEDAGFKDIQGDYSTRVLPARPRPWMLVLRTAHNPMRPSLGEIISQTLSSDEVRRLESVLRPKVEGGIGLERSASLFLAATKQAP
jgi:ubiquinone/menaquinone biosynthesis C-methylase UbiE